MSSKNAPDDEDLGPVKEKTGVKTPSGCFAFVGRRVYRNAAICVLIAPLLCLALFGYGVMNYEIEESVGTLWALSGGDYYKDWQYQQKVQLGASDDSSVLALAKARDGSNILSAQHLNELATRMAAAEATTVEHNGNTFTVADVCMNPVGPYMFPCYRMTPLDCFEEGGYNFGALATAGWTAMMVGAGIPGGWIAGKNPYTFQAQQGGAPRPSLAGASDAAVLAAASGTCTTWDEGLAYPPVSPILSYGGATPPVLDVSPANPFTKVDALQNIYRFIVPENIVARLASADATAYRPGGAIDISEKDAEEVLFKMKKAFEETYSDGWDDKDDGSLEFNCFSDDVGVVGSFGRVLEEFTLESAPLSALSYVVMLVLCTVLLGSWCNWVTSRAGLGFFGALIVIIAFLGSLGATVLYGTKLNVIQMWTLPFLMVGLGVDDMFILALAAGDATAKYGPSEDSFVAAFAEVGVPVTLTTFVNAAMFFVMLMSDIPAVYLTAQTALFAVVLMYLSVITSFASAVAFDFGRQARNRRDLCCCCITSSSPPAEAAGDAPNRNCLWACVYRPLVGTAAGQVLVTLLSLAFVGGAGYGFTKMELGLGLAEFFPTNSQGGHFASMQEDYFPVWPAQLNWGAEAYHTTEVQLQMIKQFESVTAHAQVTDLATSYVWTAAVAEWAAPSAYGLGYCSPGNALTSGNCGPALSATCTSTWVENTLGLNLKAAGGVCQSGADLVGVDGSLDAAKSYCPVLDLSEAAFGECVRLLGANTNLFASLSPGLNVEADGVTPMLPILYSRASGSSLYTYDLFDTDAYIDVISETRKGCDNDESGPHCWMSGIAYDYWEQYLTIEDWLLMISAAGVAISFVVATLFFFVNFGRFGAAICGGFVVALTSAVTLFTVTGLSCLAGVNLCGLSAMSCLMAAGFAVEYSVHVVNRFMAAEGDSKLERVFEAMDGLFLPTSMAFLSSGVGIMALMLSSFDFVVVYFFTPLFIVLVVTYWFGVFTLPVIFARLGCCRTTA